MEVEVEAEAGQGGSARVVGGTDLLQTGLHAPDLPGVLRDGAVAGELPRASDVVDHLPGPLPGVLPEKVHRQGSGCVRV